MDRYLEALKQARNYYPDNLFLGTIFPELAESEDERIRKELIEQVEYILPDKEEYDDEGRVLTAYHKRIERYRAYLEKQKPAEWSKEDKELFDSIIASYRFLLKDYKACHDVDFIPYKSDTIRRTVVNDIAFLKSLRPQSNWKPSEEQMEELRKAKELYMKSSSGIASLYYDLKTKLM